MFIKSRVWFNIDAAYKPKASWTVILNVKVGKLFCLFVFNLKVSVLFNSYDSHFFLYLDVHAVRM